MGRTSLESLENLPQKESMRHTHHREGWDMKMYDHGTLNYKIVGRYIDNILKKSIGKNFDKVKKHILEAMKEFNIARREPNLVETILTWKIGEKYMAKYVLDEQGRIQKNKLAEARTAYWAERRKERATTVKIDNENVTIRLKKTLTDKQINLLKHKLVSNGVALGDWFYNVCCGGTISSEKFQSIVFTVKEKIVGRDKYRLPIMNNDDRDFIESCFEIASGGTRHYFDYKSPEYKQWKKEVQDAKKKEQRELKKRREERYENLLHELSRKEKEEKERNIIDRDRLGFDDESFKYGQKRKKS